MLKVKKYITSNFFLSTKRVIKTSISAFILLSFTSNNVCFAENIPDIYKFAAKNSFFSINIKASEKAWSVLTQNPSFKALKLFSEFSKNNDFDVMEDKQIRDNIGENILISVPDFKPEQNKVVSNTHLISTNTGNDDDTFVMAVEMKNKSKNGYIRTKILKLFANKKDTKIVESSFRDASIISVLAKNKADNNFKPSYYIFLNNYLITTNDEKSIQSTIKSYYDQNNLTNLDNFSRSFAKLGSEYQAQMYINIKKLSDLIFDDEENIDLKAFKNHGIFINDSVLMNLNIAEKNLELKTYMIPDKANNFFKTLSETKPGNMSISNFLPKESIAYINSLDSDFSEYINNLKLQGKSFNYKSIKENLGFDLEELSDNIKGENAIVAFSTQSNPIIPGFAVFITPKDSEKMLKTINSINIDFDSISNKFSKGKSKEKTDNPFEKKNILTFSEDKIYKGYKIVSANEIPNLEQISIRPVYSFINDKVIIASNEEVIKIIIDRIKNNIPDFTLEKNQYFESLKQILGDNNNSLGYLNLDTIISMLGTFNDDKSDDMKALMFNLRKFHALGFNSINDKEGILSRIILLADIDKIDFNKIFPQKSKMNIDINSNKPAYY